MLLALWFQCGRSGAGALVLERGEVGDGSFGQRILAWREGAPHRRRNSDGVVVAGEALNPERPGVTRIVEGVEPEAEVIGNDGRRLVVRAQGIARFDGSETAPVTVRALYEQGSGRWLDTQYDFDVVGG